MKNNFKYYWFINIDFYFSKFFYIIIIEKKILKVKSTNYINILFYYKYFNIFNNLTTFKKIIITYIYFIILIIKLKLNDSSFFYFILLDFKLYNSIAIKLQTFINNIFFKYFNIL